MAESDYKVLKARIEELIESIESIDNEVASYSAAKTELLEIAGNLRSISGDMAKASKTSEAILNQVETIAVTSTLQSMRESADKYAEISENLLHEVKSSNAEHELETRNTISSLTDRFKNTLMIMGVIAIACSIVALICALI